MQSAEAESLIVMPARGRRVGMFVIATSASLAAHAAVIAWALLYVPGLPGGGGQVLEALEVDLITPGVLDARIRQATDARAHTTEVAASDGAALAEGAAEPSLANPRTQADVAVAVVTTTAETPEKTAAVLPLLPHTPSPEPAQHQPTPPEQPSSSAAAHTGATAPVGGGSVQDVPLTASTATAAMAAASPGEIMRYGVEVRKALTRAVPARRNWPAGQVTLAFTVSERGATEHVELVGTSGNARLDRLMLDWIAAARLPEPPVNISADNRRYVMPVRVR